MTGQGPVECALLGPCSAGGGGEMPAGPGLGVVSVRGSWARRTSTARPGFSGDLTILQQLLK